MQNEYANIFFAVEFDFKVVWPLHVTAVKLQAKYEFIESKLFA